MDKAAGPIANFERWFSNAEISRAKTEAERQDCKLGLIYETFRRHPEILRAKRHQFQCDQPLVSYSWLIDPWTLTAFNAWDKPWRSANESQSLPEETKRDLIAWTAAGTSGPEGVSMSVSELLPTGESATVVYCPPKPPLSAVVSAGSGGETETPIERIFIEPNGEELEKTGWKLFAVDCRSKDAVKKAVKWICNNHVPKGKNSHGRFTLKSWASRLQKWNELCGENFVGQRPVTVTDQRLLEMSKVWDQLHLDALAVPLFASTLKRENNAGH